MDGTGLSCDGLLYFSKVSEIGHTSIPNLWLADNQLRADLRLPTQHLDTLNEVWWLSRWQGIDGGSVTREYLGRRDKLNLSKKHPSTVDWRFSVLGGQITINLSVKNRRGTKGSRPLKKGVYLFGNEPDEPFEESREDEINVLAITAYHGGWITLEEEAELVSQYLDDTLRKLNRPVIDAVALSVREGIQPTSYDRLYFPRSRDLQKKDLILKAIFKPMDVEDTAKVGMNRYPISIPDALKATGLDS